MPTPRVTSALIVANGDVPPPDRIARHLPADGQEALVIAADGGVRKAELLGLAVDLVVGDGDSLGQQAFDELAERGVEVILSPTDKDASDTELAVRQAVDRGATEIVVLGALGGLRFEHALANVLLLGLPELAGRRVTLADGRTTVRLLNDGDVLELAASDGRLVSLLPISVQVSGVRTRGLRFPLDGQSLEQGPSRGLSNELEGRRGTVSIERGRLAVVQTLLGEHS